MPHYLVIVESPTKAKTIKKFLNSDYAVESSFGHIRDLPKSKMGVDIEHDFTPQYVIPAKSKKIVSELKKHAKNADIVYFATDEDREGEAISWHLQQLLDVSDERAKRIVFHEVTESALSHALAHPRSLNRYLVDAQQTRRILDRLVGYELSPFLWRKVVKGLSAGRVQSVAVRLVVEREREIQSFVTQEYWTVEIDAAQKKKDAQLVSARLVAHHGKTLEKFSIQTKEDAEKIVSEVTGALFRVADITTKDVRKTPPAPHTTSTLQQDANRRLKFSTKQTMMIAQQLYEGIELGDGAQGLITYMRTDSVSLAASFTDAVQPYLTKTYGSDYAHGAQAYVTKSKLAQEAHEAIRPTSLAYPPDLTRQYLDDAQQKLYELIWNRALASQMPPAHFRSTSIDIEASKEEGVSSLFRASGHALVFDGFTRVYPIESEEATVPALEKDEELIVSRIEPLQHFTKPPARYSEAGLVKVLEEHGIGRPSTYAPTISTIIERNYVQREDRRLKPTEIAFLVNDLLVEHFPSIVDYSFTAHLEDDLDAIALGEKEWTPVIREFYSPFKENLEKKERELSKKNIALTETSEICDKCGKPMVIRLGRFGKFMACTGFPDCKNAKPLTDPSENDAHESAADKNIPPCDKCGSPMVPKAGRFGKFYGCSRYPDCRNIRNLSDKNLGIACPQCHAGSIIQKKSKRGKIFYGCSTYPDCTYVSWTKPENTPDHAAAA